MSHHEKFKNESQDARRKDEHNAVHPDEAHRETNKSNKISSKSSELKKPKK